MSVAAALTLLAAGATQTVPLQSVCITGSGTAKPAADLLRRRLVERGATDRGCATHIAFQPASLSKEAFRIDRRAATVTIRAASTRGFVYGAGWLLRHSDNLALSLTAPVNEKPAQAIRGTQIGYRFKNNSYDAWIPAMLKRRIEDFALWGANRIQIISPRSDDAPTSPLMPVPPEQAVRDMAQATHDLGLDVAIFYPLLGDYDGGAADDAEARNLDTFLKTLPALDALYFPGGDPGHTSPDRLFPLVERLSRTLHTRFPKAELLLSTQGFDARDLDAFYGELGHRPKWLTAIFVGPQTRESAASHLRRLAGRYPLELYPDTAHAMQAQFPIPDWSHVFALTQGREPVNPRPSAEATIFAHITPGTRGAISYSEGINDDWNVHQWLAMGWDGQADIARDYANFYIGDPAFAAIPAMLETNWQGDPASNSGIDRTLSAIDAIRPAPWADWHIDLYRYRAVYDALIRERLTRARANQAEALYTLRQTPAIGAEPAVAAARFAYARPDSIRSADLYRQLTALADRLRQNAGMQLSVERHGASSWRRGANFDRAMIDLNDRVAVERDMTAALTLPTEAERVAALYALGDRWGMADFALYDDLGDPANEPHLVRGPGYPTDPQLWHTAIDGVGEHTPNEGWRMAELSYAEALFEQPLTLHYEGLEKGRAYRLRYTWAGEDYSLPLTLTANGTALPAPPARTTNPQRVELPIPPSLTASGTLDLVWSRPPGMGGSGRGRQIAEVWLIPESSTSPESQPSKAKP
ncbi:hypothetical protein MOK15_21535 [Sphingobium sp. BYY-5]|uniref:hypothetical protein n=1 Tax=Sphingobium sp. BYY-5 TaxID=2926400 RepID=UPI001FA78912|nr:hypothetical protein [Sphingobium sp. BYY-5]MCI4592643.1 hypothetical protein [Sphingobium sp. BYY-5]